MGKKIHPHALRIGITRTWDSLWYDKRGYAAKFLQDVAIRKFLMQKCEKAGIAKIEINRHVGKNSIIIYCGKPGGIIGRGGDNIEILNKELKQQYDQNFDISVQEIRKPDTNAQLIALNVADQISRRFPYRRVVKMAVDRAREGGVKGVKISVSGRLNGVDIARKEHYSFGTVPLHTLRANIEYAGARSETTYGTIGVKVWIYKGLVFKNKEMGK